MHQAAGKLIDNFNQCQFDLRFYAES